MMYAIVYDIEDDKTRTALARLLEGYGQRVQKSVFECRLDTKDLDELTERLRKTLKTPESGNIRVYRLCKDCHEASFGLGNVVTTYDSQTCIII